MPLIPPCLPADRRIDMSFRVKKRTGQAGWSLYAHIGGGKYRYVPQEAYPYGLKQEMDLIAAREFIASINSRERIKQEEVRRVASLHRKRKAEEVACAWLPEDVVSYFEGIHIISRKESKSYGKIVGMWERVKKIIMTVNFDPRVWSRTSHIFHNYWKKDPHSADYIRRVMRLLNAYGFCYGELRNIPFTPVKMPTEEIIVEVEELWNSSRKSEPLLLSHLPKLRDKLPIAQYNWVKIAFAFGLRPEECDLLYSPQSEERLSWWIEGEVLVIDQPKLRRVRKPERYKRIPAWTDLQKECLEVIKSGVVRRPSRKRVELYFPEGVTLYGCRHGFTRLMEELGQPMEKVSKWLGHRSITTTEKYYRDHGLLAKPDAA